ncbi:uncharacterized protein cenpu isoform X2 [Genypterus blacodes]|uniref:uncharacterized protein cenpu isoform X2 n=1 Tax=Genypterus blacodes TaxID=154954 RepID=UPI003F76CBCD
MRANKGRGAKMVTAPPEERQVKDRRRAPPVDLLESASLSFLQGLQKNDGNRLHSTAIDEDLILSEDGGMNRGRRGIPEKAKATTMKQRRAAVKRKDKETNEEDEKRGKKSNEERMKARPEKGGEMESKKGRGGRGGRETGHSSAPKTKGQLSPSAAPGLKRLVGKKPAKRTSEGQKSAARPKEKTKNVTQKKKKKSELSSDSISQEEFASDPRQQPFKLLLSSEEEGDADTSWKPSPKKARVQGWVRTRKSSSDTPQTRKSASDASSSSERNESTDAEMVKEDEQRKRRRKPGRAGGTESEEVLEAFLSFCERHRESLESTAVKRAFDSFSSSVKEQLLQKITSSKEFRMLRRENAKVKSLIGRKTQKLLQAKNELIRAESQVSSLQKEEVQLNERLTDLRRGHAFLQSLTQLTTQYLEYRHTHPEEKEEFGASSLPALLLQTQQILETSNNQLGTK